MFTRRQAIRWAELWLSCWNDGDFDTLLAMHKDGVRFGEWSSPSTGESRIDRKEAMKRHWADLAFRSILSPSIRRWVGYRCVYAKSFDGMRDTNTTATMNVCCPRRTIRRIPGIRV